VHPSNQFQAHKSNFASFWGDARALNAKDWIKLLVSSVAYAQPSSEHYSVVAVNIPEERDKLLREHRGNKAAAGGLVLVVEYNG
jgi:hypothetical protein